MKQCPKDYILFVPLTYNIVVAESLELCPTPLDCSLPGSSIRGIYQARKPEWVAIPFSRGSSQARDRTYISCAGRQCLFVCLFVCFYH